MAFHRNNGRLGEQKSSVAGAWRDGLSVGRKGMSRWGLASSSSGQEGRCFARAFTAPRNTKGTDTSTFHLLVYPSHIIIINDDINHIGIKYWVQGREGVDRSGVTYLLTQSLPHSMGQSPSWEVKPVLQLVKIFPSFYGTRRFITEFTSARHLSLSWASSV